MRRSSIAIALLLLLAPPALAIDLIEGKVTKVHDGDSIWVVQDGKRYKVRLYGIDCPEAKQPHGKEATAFTRDLLYGKQVKVQVVEEIFGGRHVGKVLIDGKSASQELTKAGHAWWYEHFAPDDSEKQTPNIINPRTSLTENEIVFPV